LFVNNSSLQNFLSQIKPSVVLLMFICVGCPLSAFGQKVTPELKFAPAHGDIFSSEDTPSPDTASSQEDTSSHEVALSKAPSPKPNTRSRGTFSITSKSPSDIASAFGAPLSTLKPVGRPNQFTKRDAQFAESLHSITNEVVESVVRLEGSDNGYILGTLVSTNGMIVSKYSAAQKMNRCIFSDGQSWPFRIVNFDKKKDLCLIRVNRKGLTPIKFRRDLNRQYQIGSAQRALHSINLIPPPSGSLALSVGHLDEVAAFGMVTMGLHDFQIPQPKCPDCIDMGITMSPYPALTRVDGIVYPHRRGIKVLRVYPRSTGESLGLLVGDLISVINGVRVAERQILTRETRKIRAGDVMTMAIYREGQRRELTYKVPATKKTIHDRWGGGPYSARRFGFGPVIVHDSVLDPQDCGGPLVSVQGHVIGLNIARSMRVASFAINIEDVFLFVKTRSPETKLQFLD
jgi:serine protease Do